MPNAISNVSFMGPGDDTADLMDIERRRAYALALQQQSMQAIPQQQGVPIHPFQGIAKIMQAQTAAAQQSRAQELARQLGGTQQARRGADISMLIQALQGRPAAPAGLSEDASGNVTPTDPITAQTPAQSLQQALPLMKDPQMQQMGLQAFMAQQPKRPEPYTLAPGAVRYGPDGKPIAAAPHKPEPFTLAPGGVRFGPDGKQIAVSPNEAKPLVTVDNRSENKYAETVGVKSGERDIEQHGVATSAVENIAKLDTVLEHLKSSEAITGLGSEVFKDIERAKNLVMKTEASGKRVSDTELLDTLLGSDVFPMIKALGIGARGLDTPAEREFLRSVMTGTTQMNKSTLIRMTELRKNISERAVKRWNDRVDSGELDRYFQAAGMPKQKIELPKVQKAPATPKPQDIVDELRRRGLVR